MGDVGIKRISNAAQMTVQPPKAEALREWRVIKFYRSTKDHTVT